MNVDVEQLRQEMLAEQIRLRAQIIRLQAKVGALEKSNALPGRESVQTHVVPGSVGQTPRWPGYAVMAGVVYSLGGGWSYCCPFANPEAITDNSGGQLNCWLVFNLTDETVSLEAGPAPNPQPNDQEWLYVPHIIGVPIVPRFG